MLKFLELLKSSITLVSSNFTVSLSALAEVKPIEKNELISIRRASNTT